jgi:hypothetical protein
MLMNVMQIYIVNDEKIHISYIYGQTNVKLHGMHLMLGGFVLNGKEKHQSMFNSNKFKFCC